MDKIRALIAEDYPPFRSILREFLTTDPQVELVGEARDGQEALDKVKELRPDLVLMDVSLPGMGGLAATRQIRQANPDTKVILLLEEDHQEYRMAALESGAHDCLAKVTMGKNLLPMVHSI
jgi:DNA-binding NarL/FixJ family response regulator